MNRLLCITTAALMLSALGACSPDNDELIQWMEQQHKEISRTSRRSSRRRSSIRSPTWA